MALNLLISPLISLVVKKAGNSLIEQFCQMHGLEENRDKLQRQLCVIQAVIADAESRGAKVFGVQRWLEELNIVAYEAVDLLDEFQYEALRQEVMRQQPFSAFKKVTRIINWEENPILFRYRMSNKLKNVLERINEIIIDMQVFSFIPHDPQPEIIRPPTHSYVDESEVIGRDSEKRDIMNMLLDPDREMKCVSVLPIVGMGGAGKTTLAQLVYNEEKVKAKFELRMWVCVSIDFDVVHTVKSIIEVATNGQCVRTSNLEVLQNILRNILEGKKYLLVLDDIWNEEIRKWDVLKTLLSSGVAMGSVIIVTTRSERVASIMGTMPQHDLAMLSEKDSWELFQKRAFGESEETQQFIEIGQKIIDKCAGLPLALKAIGALMRYKRDVCEWRAISESKIWDDETTKEILPALKLSYDYLPCYMKQCFAFCAIFPQDYEIEKETLIQLCMANDYIPINQISDLEGKGQDIFDELCRRSFFQDIREMMNYDNLTIRTICKMHDVMHDLAKHVAGKHCATMLEVENSPVFHVSTIGRELPYNLNSILNEFPVIRTCLIEQYGNELEDNSPSYSVKLIPLRALGVKNINQLPKEIGFMKHLRYLDLSDSVSDSLPETISTLYNLQTLKLSNSKISKLPDDMRYMVGLRHLFIDGCDNLKRMPIGLGQLRCLRTLTNYMVECDPGRTIGELNNLNIKGRLVLSGLENVRDKNEASAANMVSKKYLSSLTLEWHYNGSRSLCPQFEGIVHQDILDVLRPSTDELRTLRIDGYQGIDLPVWMKNTFVLGNVRTLCFNSCNYCTTLPPVWCLPLLEELELISMDGLVYICSSQGSEVDESGSLTMFPKLKKMNISHLTNLERWHENNDKQLAFPRLEELTIKGCSRLQLHQISNLVMVPSSVLRISQYSMKHGAFRPPRNVVTMFVTGIMNITPLEEDEEEICQEQTLRNLTIGDSKCFSLSGPSKIELKFWMYFVSLETLDIRACGDLYIWPEQEFRSLKCLKKLSFLRCKNFTGMSEIASSPCKSNDDFNPYYFNIYYWFNEAGGQPLFSKKKIKNDEDILPRLENLGIMDCPVFVEIPRCFKSLKTLTLSECPSISIQGLNWLKNLHQLKALVLIGCKGLKTLPEGMDSLTSLKHLSIQSCRRIESFPEGLQQRLSALQYLEIENCPVLERHCRSGGYYHHLVSVIPQLHLSEQGI